MKSVFLIMLFLVSSLFAQGITVIEDKELTRIDEGQFYYPVLSPDGNVVLFSSENRRGLWYKNLGTGNIKKLTNSFSSGYEPSFNKGGQEIIYREDKFVKGKRTSSLVSANISTGKTTYLANNIRDLKMSTSGEWRCYIYYKENILRSYQVEQSLDKKAKNEVSVFIENSKITLLINDEKRILEPLGNGNYIWPSVSPDQSKILFTLAGSGTYISDLEGNVIADLGHANYPSWSEDGKWVAAMEDFDDGVKMTSSNILVMNLDGSEKYNLTKESKLISMYPSWGKAANEIVYNTLEGQIRKITVKY